MSPWIVNPRPRPLARVRLFCLPYAGGGCGVFRTWADQLPDEVEVLGIQPPGREARLMEPPLSSVRAVVEAALPEVRGQLDRPAAVFGHSMGALVAFELCRALERAGGPRFSLLVPSAHRAPDLPNPTPLIHDLPDAEFVAEVDRRYQAIPPEVRQHQELMQLMLPGLRADIAVCDTYRYEDGPPLSCPILALAGDADDQVGPGELDGWGQQTSAGFRAEVLPGDHFFLQSAAPALLRLLGQELQGLTSSSGPAQDPT